MSLGEGICPALFGLLLLFACATDIKTKRVYRFTWYLALPLIFISFRQQIDTGTDALQAVKLLGELFCFVLLQEAFFCRFYGRGDAHAFSACAGMLWAFGAGLYTYLWMMLYALFCLGVHQAFRRNIAAKGNLKEPVAFLPYITVGFWVSFFLLYGRKI